MKITRLIAVPSLALSIIFLHLLPLRLQDCFGFDQLRFFSQIQIGIGIAVFILALLWFSLAPPEDLNQKTFSKIFPPLIILLWLTVLFSLPCSAPLLGDGLDRILSLHSGLLPMIRHQPAPLDLTLHWILFQAIKTQSHSDFLTYRILSYGAGFFYLAMVFISGRKFFSDQSDRNFWTAILLFQGFIQLFAGYAENYSFLPGLFLFWIIGVKETESGKTRTILWSQVLLILFHFFSLLLLPATIYLLLSRSGKNRRGLAVFLTLGGAIFSGLSLFLVWRYYRGIAIFLTPDKIFSLPHLLDFFNHQILASPAVLLLLLGTFIIRPKPGRAGWEKVLLLASLILPVFFFALRPVIGAARDWDLFSIPAMVYTPALLIYLLPRLKSDRRLFSSFAIMVLLVSLFQTTAWLKVNHSEEDMVKRITYHLDRNQKREQWASAYGYMTLGKYYMVTARPEDATLALEKSVEIHPGYSQNRLALGIQLWAMGRYPEAVNQLEQAHRINPTNPGIKKTASRYYLEYAQMLIRGSQFPDAEKYLQKGFQLDPRGPAGIQALADFYRNNSPDPERAQYYQKLLEQAEKRNYSPEPK